MQEIAPQVYIEDRYPGVVLGLLVMAQGSILIDSPPCPDNARSWKSALRAFNGRGPNHVLIYLDHHPDRCLGGRHFSNTIVAHEHAALVFSERPNMFRSQTIHRGENWELCPSMQGVRWGQPNVFFDEAISFHWDDDPVTAFHRGGVSPSAVWVVWPSRRVIFVGDTVTAREPPFLAEADFATWEANLDELARTYADYRIIGSRDGVLRLEHVLAFRDWLHHVHEELRKARARRLSAGEIARKLTEANLSRWVRPDLDEKRRNLYQQRLLYGFEQAYQNLKGRRRQRQRRRKR